MHKYLYTILLAALLMVVGCSNNGKVKKIDVTICATTDIHGKYFDSLYVDNQANKTSLANVSTHLKNLRSSGRKPVLIDVGDNLQGDNASYYFNFEDTTSNLHLYSLIAKYLKYDAIVAGNHDIETGHPVYDKVRSEIGIPYLAANALYDSGAKEGEPYFDQYTIVKRGGAKIAIIGFTNAHIKYWIAAELYSGIDFTAPSVIAQDLVDKVIAKEHPDIVVLAMHSGTGDGSSDDTENQGKYIASFIKGVDLILCGHDHSPFAEYIENPNGDVLLLNASNRCSVLAQCEISIEKVGKVVKSKKFEYRLIPMADVPVDEEYMAEFHKYFDIVQDFTLNKIGYIQDNIYTVDALYGPSAYLTLIHKVQKEAAEADISFSAPLTVGGVIKKGDINFQDLFTFYPFENQLYVIQMTGTQIKNYLEMSYDAWINKSTPTYNYDSAYGINYTVNKKKAKGERVVIGSMSDGSPFDLQKVYKVAINSYRASGAGQHLQDGAGIDPEDVGSLIVYRGPQIRDLLHDYIVKEREIVPNCDHNWKFIE